MNKFILIILLSAIAPLALATDGTPINEHRPLSATGKITVNNLSGVIEVRAWDKNEVEITGTLGRGSEKLDIKGGGDRLDIEVRLPARARNVESSELFLRVPEGAQVELESVSADLTVNGTRGPVRVTSVSGDVTIEGPMREVRAETVSGDMTVKAASAETRLQSVSGDIQVRQASGIFRAETVSGDLKVSGGNFAEVDVEAVSGDLELKLDSLNDDAEVRVDSVSGNVEFTVPKTLNTQLRLETYSGDLRSDFGKQERDEPERISATLGSGKGRFQVETHSGDITLRGR
jgi:DUF4097 and DUF4098 domain-containing protein YvlB